MANDAKTSCFDGEPIKIVHKGEILQVQIFAQCGNYISTYKSKMGRKYLRPVEKAQKKNS